MKMRSRYAVVVESVARGKHVGVVVARAEVDRVDDCEVVRPTTGWARRAAERRLRRLDREHAARARRERKARRLAA